MKLLVTAAFDVGVAITVCEPGLWELQVDDSAQQTLRQGHDSVSEIKACLAPQLGAVG